jgi:phosphate-selective porin OprO/OprP
LAVPCGPALAGAPSPTDAPVPAQEGTDFRVFWKDGFRLETADKAFSARISGRVQYDAAFFSGDEADLGVELEDGAKLRRLYTAFEGKYYGLDFKSELDFGDGKAKLQDTFLAWSAGDIGRLTVGHFKEPFGMEELTSDLHTPFMERSLAPFSPARNIGVQLSDTASEEKLTWAVGAFRSNSDNDAVSDGADEGYAFTGRVTGLVWTGNEGRDIGHLGAAFTTRQLDNEDGTKLFDTKPESNISPALLTPVVTFFGEGLDIFGLEAAAIVGSFTFAAEYNQAALDGDVGAESDPDMTAWYAWVSYLLTGESRSYNRKRGVFDRVKPATNYGKGGWGAFELGARLTSYDYDDALADSKMDDVTVGANWYMNAYVKWMLNVVHADVDSVDEAIDIVQLRVQFDY